MFGINLQTNEEGADWIQSQIAVYLSVGFACLSVIISIAHIIQHLMHYSMPGIQIYVIRILVICPVYAISSSLALALGNNGAYAEIARDVYEAFVIYSFFNLILEYSGGETDCIYQIENEPQLHMPCPLCFLKPRPRDARLMRFCHRGVLQFVIIKPIVAALDIIMIATKNKSKFGYEVFVFIVYNISYGWALYCMFVFYQAIQKLIKKFRPILKFASVKAIVFATYYQSLAVQASSMSPENTVRWNDFILCIEMVFFAGLLMVAFPTSEFQGGIPDSKFIENVRSVLSVHDVMQDVYHNFIPVYHDYTLQRSETEAPEVVRMKTYLAGNLDSVAIEMSHRYRGRNKRLAFNSLLRGSTPISARLRNYGGYNGTTNRLFHTRLRTESENSSDISDSEQYYDEESIHGSNSQDGLDDSTDSTMDLCPQHSNNQRQNQSSQKSNQRYIPQFNANELQNSKYIVLNGGNSAINKDEESDEDDDIESIKLQQKKMLNQNKLQTMKGFTQKFHHHKVETKNNNQTKSNKDQIDYDTPLNLHTKTLISPLEQDILERRAISMSTHGIGFVVTKRGVEIRSSDYHPTEEEGVLNEGFMSLDDSSHHSKYDRSSLNSSPLIQSQNPAAANLPRLPKISIYRKPSPEKSSPNSSEKISRSDNISIQPLSIPSKQLPSFVALPPPPSDKNLTKVDSNEIDSDIKENNDNTYDHDSDGSDEEWGWGDFVHHGANFAEFPPNNNDINNEDNHLNNEINHNNHKIHSDDDLCIIDKDPFNENIDNKIYEQIKSYLNEIISKIEYSLQITETKEIIEPTESIESIKTNNNDSNFQSEGNSFLIVSEIIDNDKLNLRERESSTESDNIVIISIEKDTENNINQQLNSDQNNEDIDETKEINENIGENNIKNKERNLSSKSNSFESSTDSESYLDQINHKNDHINDNPKLNCNNDSENNDDIQVIIPIVLEDVNYDSNNNNNDNSDDNDNNNNNNNDNNNSNSDDVSSNNSGNSVNKSDNDDDKEENNQLVFRFKEKYNENKNDIVKIRVNDNDSNNSNNIEQQEHQQHQQQDIV